MELFLYTNFREEIRNWLRDREGRESSKDTQGNVCHKSGGKFYFQGLYQFTVRSSKIHINYVNLSVGFFYRAHVLEMRFPTVLVLCCLTLHAT